MNRSEQLAVVDSALATLAELKDEVTTLSKTASASVKPDVDPQQVFDFVKGMSLWA